MTDLSPQAQAVLDAFGKHPLQYDTLVADMLHGALPAALEAAADQVVPEELHPQVYQDCCDYAGLRARMSVRTQLLAIAAELRGKGDFDA